MSKFIEALRVAAQARAEKDAAWLTGQWANEEIKIKCLEYGLKLLEDSNV